MMNSINCIPLTCSKACTLYTLKTIKFSYSIATYLEGFGTEISKHLRPLQLFHAKIETDIFLKQTSRTLRLEISELR